MRILITVPELNRTGGVTTLFNSLKMEESYSNVRYFEVHNNLPGFIRIPYKCFEFLIRIRKFDIIHLNPSLNFKSFMRDSVFVWLSLLCNKKVIVYWHGWEEDFEKRISSNPFLRFIAQRSFLNAGASIVLGSLFECKLRGMGYLNEIYQQYIENKELKETYLINKQAKNISNAEKIKLLFISRMQPEKGIYIAIETLKLLNKDKDKYILIIAGTGSEDEKVQSLIKGREDIKWLGHIGGEFKLKMLDEGDILFFPTFYPEGMPLNIIECMLYGMPVISRPAGGISDIVKNGVNGYLTESKEPVVFENIINQLVNDPLKYNEISKNNLNSSYLFDPITLRKR